MKLNLTRAQISREIGNITDWVVNTYRNIEVWDYAYCFGDDQVRLIGHLERPVWDKRR